MKPSLMDVLTFVQFLGFKLSVDFNDELEIEWPLSVDMAQVERYLRACGVDEVKRRLKHRAKLERDVFTGGPMNGQKTWNYQPGERGGGYCIKVAPRRWAVYRPIHNDSLDGRAVFVQWTTSREKGKAILAGLLCRER